MSIVELILASAVGIMGMMAVSTWLPQIFQAQKAVDAREEALQSLRSLERRFSTMMETGSPLVTTSYYSNGAAEAVFVTISPGNTLSARNICVSRPKEKSLSSATLRSAIGTLDSGGALSPLGGCTNLGVANCNGTNSVPVVEVMLERNGTVVERSTFPSEAMLDTTGAFLCLRKFRSFDYAGGPRDEMMIYFVAAHYRSVKKSATPSALDQVGWQSSALRIPPTPSP